MMFNLIPSKKGISGIALGGAFLLVSMSAGCSSSPEQNTVPDDYLAIYDGEILTRADVQKALPRGLSPEDSARFVKAYVSNWVQSNLLLKEAAHFIDMEEIDRMTEDYRRELILTDYRRKMYETNGPTVSDDSVRAYYDKHKEDFVLERPLVRGVYLKVADDAKNLPTLKRLHKSDKPQDADILEKEVLSTAIHYDYFRDKWVDWVQIESKIPEDFGADADAWLKKNHNLEKSVGGFTYLLDIDEVLPSGSPMPIEAARAQIINRLLNQRRPAYDANIMNELYQKAVADEHLIIHPDIN